MDDPERLKKPNPSRLGMQSGFRRLAFGSKLRHSRPKDMGGDQRGAGLHALLPRVRGPVPGNSGFVCVGIIFGFVCHHPASMAQHHTQPYKLPAILHLGVPYIMFTLSLPCLLLVLAPAACGYPFGQRRDALYEARSCAKDAALWNSCVLST